MIGRKLALPLDRLTRGSQKSGRLDDPSIQDHVSKQQRRQKRYFDKRNNIESKPLSRGKKVHVRANVRPDKYTPFWTAPKQFAKQVAPNTVMLDDGNVRNQRDLVVGTKKCGPRSPAKLRPTQAASTSQEPATPDSIPVEAASAMPNVAAKSTHDAGAKAEAEVAAPQAVRRSQRVRY